MTTSDPTPTTEKRGRHARSADYADPEPNANQRPDGDPPGEAEAHGATPPGTGPEDTRQDATSPEEPPEEQAEDDERPAQPQAQEYTETEPEKSAQDDEPEEVGKDHPAEDRPAKRSWFRPGRTLHPLGHHPAGTSLLMSSGLLIGLSLAPVIFDQLDFDIATRAARAARSAAAPWPGGGEPWFWPSWVAMVAAVVAAVLIVLAFTGLRLPDLAVLVLGVVLTVSTARAAWATLDVVNSRLWDLLPLCLICLLAFGLAISGTAHWRSPEDAATGTGAGGAAGVVAAGAALSLILLAGGAAVASVQAKGLGPGGPPQDVAGLLSTRAADAPEVDVLDGGWAPQLAAAQVGDDDAAATAFSARHRDSTTRTPALLARGDDVGSDLDDTWWVSLAAQRFGSEQEAAQWCASSGLPECVPLEVSG
ncbi:hypothetical protein [Blastococcus litoris]|uniref:hypothetical protein n=1 Tax=Blastococcus litoris TaxID=2171622 RepID=UPI0013E013A1|nr:hypothetical protein [Blastococcus litoris]